MDNCESTKADQCHLSVSFERRRDGVKKSIDQFFGFGYLQIRLVSNSFDQFGFVHHYLLIQQL